MNMLKRHILIYNTYKYVKTSEGVRRKKLYCKMVNQKIIKNTKEAKYLAFLTLQCSIMDKKDKFMRNS